MVPKSKLCCLFLLCLIPSLLIGQSSDKRDQKVSRSVLQQKWQRGQISIINRYSGYYLVTSDTLRIFCESYYKFNPDGSFEIHQDEEQVCQGSYTYEEDWGELTLMPESCDYTKGCVDKGWYDEFKGGQIYQIRRLSNSSLEFQYDLYRNEPNRGVLLEIYRLLK